MVGSALIGVFLVLVCTSSWLKGRTWFIATVVVLAASLVAVEWDSQPAASQIEFWLTFGWLVFVFLCVFYVIGGRYLTNTEAMDITYQSHDALVRFIEESGDSSLFARIMRRMGPMLFALLLLLGAIVVWAKISGALR